MLESAAACAKDSNQIERAIELFKSAAHNFQEHGDQNSASTTYSKAGGVLLSIGKHFESVEMYLETVDIICLEGKPKEAKQPLEKALSVAVKGHLFDKVTEILERQKALFAEISTQPHNINKTILMQIVIELHLGDLVSAERIFEAQSMLV